MIVPTDEATFLRTILANPDDRVTRLVYADWLDEHGEPSRVEFIRLGARRAELAPSHSDLPAIRERLNTLRVSLPTSWLASVGGLRAVPVDESAFVARVNTAADTLRRPAKHTDSQGYEIEISAAATSELTGAMAYLECRSKWIGQLQDIHYHLRLRDLSGRTAAWEPETYNPFFGCFTQFLEWYGDEVLFVYREKHSTYLSRFGLESPPAFCKLEYRWVLDGHELGYRRSDETTVRRFSVPALDALPELSEQQAVERDLFPEAHWE